MDLPVAKVLYEDIPSKEYHKTKSKAEYQLRTKAELKLYQLRTVEEKKKELVDSYVSRWVSENGPEKVYEKYIQKNLKKNGCRIYQNTLCEKLFNDPQDVNNLLYKTEMLKEFTKYLQKEGFSVSVNNSFYVIKFQQYDKKYRTNQALKEYYDNRPKPNTNCCIV